jgi:hypothetical protein
MVKWPLVWYATSGENQGIWHIAYVTFCKEVLPCKTCSL